MDSEKGVCETENQTPRNKLNLHERVREFEINLIKIALAKTGGNQRKAAEILGIKTTTLHQKIKTHGIKLKITPANFDN